MMMFEYKDDRKNEINIEGPNAEGNFEVGIVDDWTGHGIDIPKDVFMEMCRKVLREA